MRRSFERLPPWHESPLIFNDFSGRSLKNNPDSSALNISLGAKSISNFGRVVVVQ